MSKPITDITTSDELDYAPLKDPVFTKQPEFFGQLIYLASPYTHKDKAVLVQRFHAAVDAMGWLTNNDVKDGKHFYSPIVHAHPITERCTLPIVWEFWENFDKCILSRCSEMWILTIPGFSTSTGVKAERRIAERYGLPIKFIIPSGNCVCGTYYTVTDTEPEDVSA